MYFFIIKIYNWGTRFPDLSIGTKIMSILIITSYSIPSLNRHLWGFSKLAVYPVWRFKEVSMLGVRSLRRKQFWHHVWAVGAMTSIAYAYYTTTCRSTSTAPIKYMHTHRLTVSCLEFIDCSFFFFRCFFSGECFLFVGGLTRVFNNGWINSVLKKALANGGRRLIEVKHDFI